MARVTSRISSASIAISNERRIEVTEAVEIQARHHLRSHSHARLRLTGGYYRYTLPLRVAGSREYTRVDHASDETRYTESGGD